MKQNTQNLRRSILVLQNEYEAGINNQLEKVMTAWAYIKALPPTDPNSFFTIGGYHGEPFAGEGATNPQWWGGYCNHANVLFPTWHRAYLYKLEMKRTIIPQLMVSRTRLPTNILLLGRPFRNAWLNKAFGVRVAKYLTPWHLLLLPLLLPIR